jgi:hypothetical protein
MAKNTVEIGVKVNDDGSVDKLAVSAKKAGKGLDDVSKSAQTADRNIKGAAQTSSSGTKNFSKMAQGMGGLVAVYATFAAQMFAISAAFGFFKRAGDLDVLRKGQQVYASTTGIAMQALTKDIMAATGAQIAFRDASQAAAIGVASGLSPEQLEGLGKAARDASAVLGRDVTDSFNRLVKGVTKAEPELLDELGIILRLTEASEEYALALGKDVNALTTFEKSQAVANNVLKQSEEKYGKMLALVGGSSTNEFNKLSVAFDEIVMKIQTTILPAANALARVLIDTPYLAGASFALLASGPLRALGFNLKGTSEAAYATGAAITANAMSSKIAIDAATASMKAQSVVLQQQSAIAVTAGSNSKLMAHLAGGGQLTKAGMSTLKKSLAAANVQIKNAGKVTAGIFKGLSAEIVIAMTAAFKEIELQQEVLVVETAKDTSKLKAMWLGVSATASKAFGGILKWGGRLLSAAGWLGLLYTVGMTVYDMFFKQAESADVAADKVDGYRQKIADLNEEYKNFLETQKIKLDGNAESSQASYSAGGAVANLVASTGTGDVNKQRMADYRDSLRLENEILAVKERNRAKDVAFQASVSQNLNATEKQRLKALHAYKDSLEKIPEQTEAMKNAIANVNSELESLDFLTENYGPAELLKNYRTALVEGMDDKAITKHKLALTNHLKEIATLPKVAAEASTALKSFNMSLAPPTQGENTIDALQKEIDLIEKAKKARGFYMDDEANEVGRNKNEIEFIQKVEAASLKTKLDSLRTSRAIAGAERIRNPVVRSLAKAAISQAKSLTDIENKEAAISLLTDKIAKNKTGATDSQTRTLAILREELAGLKVSEALTSQKLSDTQKLLVIELKLNTLKTDTSLLTKEKQIIAFGDRKVKQGQQLLKLEQDRKKRESTADKRDFKDSSAFSFLFQDKFDASKDLQAAKDLEKTQRDAVEAERTQKLAMIDIEYALLDAKMLHTQLELEKIALDSSLTQEQRDKAKGLAGTVKTQRGTLTGETGLVATAKKIVNEAAEGKLSDITANITKLTNAKGDLSDMAVLTESIATSFSEGISTAFTDMVTGAKSAKQAFADMATNMLKNIASLLSEMLMLKMIKSMFGLSFDGGGIMDKGKKVESYSTGGVAKGSNQGHLAMLHGTEAVVPLPDGKSIPVQMSGNGGATNNNIVVNISTDGQSSNKGSTGPDMDKLGAVVATAVQVELQNQKRSGGILNPYGAA